MFSFLLVVKPAPVKTRIGFQARIVFAAVNSFRKEGLNCHVVLKRKVDSPRFFNIDNPISGRYTHNFRVEAPEDIDEAMTEWLKEAYESEVKNRS